ncbi:adenine phosphoribosyltransferase [candidate division WOR-3 bacterium]|nr:adenine phosphoribosyltransferase [candidate division WOR-3 bacterium]
MDLKKYIRSVPDFPKKGILFKDITTLLKDPEAFKHTIDVIVKKYKGEKIDKIVSVEARGYIFGGALAYILNCGFVPVRKPGKLPGETVALDYTLEYGTNRVEIHKDGIQQGDKVLVFDDLLATGGTVHATCKLVEQLGGKIIGCAFLINLKSLSGTEKLKEYPIFSLIEYD